MNQRLENVQVIALRYLLEKGPDTTDLLKDKCGEVVVAILVYRSLAALGLVDEAPSEVYGGPPTFTINEVGSQAVTAYLAGVVA